MSVGTRPVMLVRYRAGVVGETARTVHLVPVYPDAAGMALCGVLLPPDLMEPVTLGQGMPCSLCLLSQASAGPPPTSTLRSATAGTTVADRGSPAAALTYQAWGWAVTWRGEQVSLMLEPDAVALIVPIPLAAQVSTLLRQRRCPPPVLAYPDRPEHHVMLAGERYGVTLPWPEGIHRNTGTIPLPPTPTAYGPVTWVLPPEPDALKLCREIDVFSALRTAQRDPLTT